MRLYIKLAVIVGVGCGLQLLIQRFEAELDDAQFTLRMMLSRGTGPAESPELLDAAAALRLRQIDRIWRKVAADRAAAGEPTERNAVVWYEPQEDTETTTRPAGGRDASVGDHSNVLLAAITAGEAGLVPADAGALGRDEP